MTACTHCGTDLPVGLKFCKQCGTPVAATRNDAAGAPCRSCHAVLTPGQRFCNKCGTPVASANDNGAIETDAPAPPAESAPQPAYAAAESTHAPAHDIGVESPAANTAPNDIPHVSNIADTESGRASAPLQSHDAAATVTPNAAADHRGDTVAASQVSPVVTDGQPGPAGTSASTEAVLAADDTIAVEAVAESRDVPDTDTAAVPDTEPMRPASGVMPRPIAQPATANDDTSARLKLIAAGVAVAVACAGGAFWWHGRQASAPATPEPVAASTVPAVPANAASDITGAGTVIASAVVATTPADTPASAPIDTATAAAVTASPASGPAVVTNVATASVPATPPASNPPTASANAQQTSPFAKLQDDAPAPAAPAAVAEASRNKPRPAPPVRAATAANPTSPAVDGLLKRAQGDLSRGQYDKAIATAESVLAIEPGNRPAKTLIGKAKARQMDALRNNSTLE
ncbi:zinc ribbon domain-containing protein [Burkholderia cepacia]|uniref:double zinc ribbon domain-containing protein n=2 Tax=Burkholderia cepacia TaxID=292 RepID=UPI00158F36F4|nr:zinc ribbon domain-containing protein [Burkholderia cepacia]MDN7898867.1 zinc ribbon domain-containing protein [Burkholderia cepacia]